MSAVDVSGCVLVPIERLWALEALKANRNEKMIHKIYQKKL
jgi:hypothetical protein